MYCSLTSFHEYLMQLVMKENGYFGKTSTTLNVVCCLNFQFSFNSLLFCYSKMDLLSYIFLLFVSPLR